MRRSRSSVHMSDQRSASAWARASSGQMPPASTQLGSPPPAIGGTSVRRVNDQFDSGSERSRTRPTIPHARPTIPTARERAPNARLPADLPRKSAARPRTVQPPPPYTKSRCMRLRNRFDPRIRNPSLRRPKVFQSSSLAVPARTARRSTTFEAVIPEVPHGAPRSGVRGHLGRAAKRVKTTPSGMFWDKP